MRYSTFTWGCDLHMQRSSHGQMTGALSSFSFTVMAMALFQLEASYIGQRSSYINLQKDLHTNNTALLPLLNHCFSRVEEITCGQQKIVPSHVNLTLNIESTKKLDGSLYLTLTTVAQLTQETMAMVKKI